MARRLLNFRQLSKFSHSELFRFRVPQKSFSGISEHSWAAEVITRNGGTLKPEPLKADVYVTLDVINSPPDRVNKLIDEVVKLNVVECQQLFKLIQVVTAMRTQFSVWVIISIHCSMYRNA